MYSVTDIQLEIDRAGKFDVCQSEGTGNPSSILEQTCRPERSLKRMGKIFTPDMVLGPARKGIKLTYTTDTRPADSIWKNAEKSDLFICEGMYGEKEKAAKAVEYKHMTFYEAAALAKKAQVREMWLTHYSPSLTPARAVYGGSAQNFSRCQGGNKME